MNDGLVHKGVGRRVDLSSPSVDSARIEMKIRAYIQKRMGFNKH